MEPGAKYLGRQKQLEMFFTPTWKEVLKIVKGQTFLDENAD